VGSRAVARVAARAAEKARAAAARAAAAWVAAAWVGTAGLWVELSSLVEMAAAAWAKA